MADEPPKKDGKKKLTKAEKERLKREEQERKAQEEEEARLQAIEETRKAKERERVEAKERKKLENEEKKVRKVQMSELDTILQSNRSVLQNQHDERRKKAKWARYMRCDGSPDPTVSGEINTYINLRREQVGKKDAKSILKDCEMDLNLISELEYMLEDTPLEEISDRERAGHNETVEELQSLIQSKMDQATLQILCDSTVLQDHETYNLQYTVKNSEIHLCIWGNLSKNPRIKSFEFGEKGFTFEIPRMLALSDCAFRVMFTRFDHFSPYSRSFYPRRKKKEEVPPEPEVKEEEEKPAEEEEKKEGEEGEEEGISREETEDLLAQLREMEGETEEKPEEEEEKKEEEEEEDDFEDPSTPEPPEWDDFDEDDDVVDLRAYYVLGGVFCFNLMSLPPQPKLVNSWTVTRLVNPPEIQYMDYVADSAQTANQTKDQKDTQTQEKDKRDEKPPIGVTMRLPEDVLFQEEPQVARWDDKNKYWLLDGFTDITYNEESRVFGFKTSHFGTMALLQDAHINMPFQSWEIRPRALNKAVLTVIAAISEIEIEIENSMCCLASSSGQSELKHLEKRMMTPKDLIQSLRKAGVNIFPFEDSSKYVSIQNKHHLVEARMYEQMALTASAMAYSWSKWNSEVQDQEKVIFQGAEHLVDERLLEEDWAVFAATKRRVMKLKVTDFEEEFSEELAENTEFKSNLYHLLLEIGSDEVKERIKESSYEFIDCVHQILEATKVLTYA